jgi:uncharacterized damage-inducible protein DinB
MSNAAVEPNAPSKSLRWVCDCFLKDLKALPESAFEREFGGKARLLADIVYEVNLVNNHIGMVIRNEEPFVWPEGQWIKAPESFAGKEHIVAAFEESSARILATAEALSEADLQTTVMTEWGERTREERIRFMAWHVGYHDGQLNFIQTLLGDESSHWG